MDEFIFISKEGEPDQKDKEALVKGLLSHHASKGHERKSVVYSIFVRNQNNEPVAGIIVTFLWNGMEISSLWVDESIRNKGLGRKLMKAVEDEAVKRGCTIAYTNTFTWQAGEFYTKLGYSLYGKLEDFPKGKFLSYFQKKLK